MKLKDIGSSLQLPIAIFPLAAILNGLGYFLERVQIKALYAFATLFKSIGNMVLDQMPMLFAIGVAFGLGKERKNIYALNGLLCYLVVKNILIHNQPLEMFGMKSEIIKEAFLNSDNQFIGILSGVVSVVVLRYWLTVKKDNAMFSGIFVSVASMIFLSLVLVLFWPLLYSVLLDLGRMISELGPIGAGIYGFLNRLLLPIGMHHTLNSVFWFDVLGINDIGNFWSSKGIKGITGMYQAGFYPIMLAGVPAMALAMYKNSFTTQKKRLKSFYFSAGLSSILTGITEPLEFSFMYQAPILYIFHAILCGFSLFLCASLKWIAGFSFSAGLIDYILSLAMPLANHPLNILFLCILFFGIYYFSFSFLIRHFNFHTVGRIVGLEEGNYIENQDINDVVTKIIKACGGSENIVHVNYCTTRLRIELKNTEKFNFKELENTGAIDYKFFSNEVQIVYGVQAEHIYDMLQKYYI